MGDADVDAGASFSADAGAPLLCVLGKCVECAGSDDCGGSQPWCVSGQCAACSANPAQGCTASAPNCAEGPSPKANRCVQCLLDEQCGDSAVCEGNACVTCVVSPGPDVVEPGTDAVPTAQVPTAQVPDRGCLLAAPVCIRGAVPAEETEPAPELACVQCETTEDCGRFGLGGWCSANVCFPCDPATHTGCSQTAPRCLEGNDNDPLQNTCVACLNNNDCSADPNTPVCFENSCVGCEPEQDVRDCSATPAASRCDAATCVPCLADEDCAGDERFDGADLPACKQGEAGASNVCVECTTNEHCPGESVCNAATNLCVECTTNEHCPDPDASVCNVETNACQSCQTNDDCRGIAAGDVCFDESCVECTSEDDSACGGNSCDPVAFSCTNTERGSVQLCEPCKADSECMNLVGSTTRRCIVLPQSEDEAYCFGEPADTLGCTGPFPISLRGNTRSGHSGDRHCIIRSSVTTCEAVRSFFSAELCGRDDRSDPFACAQEGAHCGTVDGNAGRCTIGCLGPADCPAGFGLECSGGACIQQ